MSQTDTSTPTLTPSALVQKMGINITTGKVTKEIFEYLVEYFKDIDLPAAGMIGEPFMIQKGTTLENNASRGLAADVVGFVIRNESTIAIMSMINAFDQPAVMSRRQDTLPDGSVIEVDQYVSEVFDGVYASILSEHLPKALPKIFEHGFEEAIVHEAIVLRNNGQVNDEEWIKNIVRKGIGMAVQTITAESSTGITGIKAMTNNSGELLIKGDTKPRLISNITRPSAIDSVSENGVMLDPVMLLNISEKDKHNAGTEQTLNVVSRESAVLNVGVTASVVFIGPEDPNSVYKREPAYRSFATQLIVDSVDHGPIPSIGNTLMSIAAVTDLTPVSIQQKMFNPESLAALDDFVHVKGYEEPALTPEEVRQNYDGYFDMLMRSNPLVSLRVIPGTTAAVVESAFLAGKEPLTRAVANFFGVKVSELPVGLQNVEPILSIEHSLLGTFTDDNNEERSLTSLDSLYIYNACRGDEEVINRWLLASSGKLSPGVSRKIKEEIFSSVTKGRYKIIDASAIISLDPRWVNGLAEAFFNFFHIESNAHSFVQWANGYTPYMDTNGYNSFQYDQNPTIGYGGYGLVGGHYTHVQHNNAGYY